jgi:hypothetical protein
VLGYSFWCFVWSVCLGRCYSDNERGSLYLYSCRAFIRWSKERVYSAAKMHIFRFMQTFTIEYASWGARARFSTPSYTVNYPIIYSNQASPESYVAGSFTIVFRVKVFYKKCRILRKIAKLRLYGINFLKRQNGGADIRCSALYIRESRLDTR